MVESIEENLKINKNSWDEAAERFFGRAALPDYGPFAPSEDQLHLFGDLTDVKVLDIGCGSGHSMKYMVSKGVQEIWGLDLSQKQVETANQVLGLENSPHIFESAMEEDPGIPHHYFDVVYSIYALGWTLDLSRTLRNINNYLKPGGKLIFSWEHPIHSRIVNEDDHLQFVHSYHDESPKLHEAWKPTPAVFHFRRLSTYLNLLIESGFKVERVIEDVELQNDGEGQNFWYHSQKAEQFPATFIIKAEKV